MNNRGFYGIGIYHPKHLCNQGTLWRSALCFGAAFVFTVGKRFRDQASDTTRSYRHIPMLHFLTLEDLVSHLPHSCPLVGVELDGAATPLDRYVHPERACYLLGAEDRGLPPEVMGKCVSLIQIDGLRHCLNVSTAGSLVMYDRMIQKVGTKTRRRDV